SKHSKHAAGFSFFGAVGVVPVQLASGADAGVLDFVHAERAALLDNFGGEIDFVVQRTNTRTEVHDHVRRIGPDPITDFMKGVSDDAELSAFAPGMHKPDRECFWIYDVNRATIGDVNSERDAALLGDNAVAAGEFATRRTAATVIYNGYFVSMNLFRGEQGPIADPDCAANFSMRGVEPLQDFGLVV